MIRIAVGTTVLVLALAAVAPTGASTGKLVGTVGPSFTISLKFQGKKVTKLKAGRYKLVVSDKASVHSFVLEGRGFEKTVTSVPFMGAKTITVTLKKGKYEFYCKPHESIMHGQFTVT